MDFGQTWSFKGIRSLPGPVSGHPEPAAESGSKIYVPTQAGIYAYDKETRRLTRMDWGLPTGHIREIDYNPSQDVLLAATDQGLFTMSYPESSVFLYGRAEGVTKRKEEILAFFKHEPTIQDLQAVAMKYAEVHPEKIDAWRKAAAMKSWAPSLNIGLDNDSYQTVDVDRGGTGDPDKFIYGPNRKNAGASVGLTWNLSELLWNPDQTSIDSRSKLMVELRDEILNELTHLYYARRRLQIEALLSPEHEISKAIERDLQIQEYTAGIDALTGGFFSRALRKNGGGA